MTKVNLMQVVYPEPAIEPGALVRIVAVWLVTMLALTAWLLAADAAHAGDWPGYETDTFEGETYRFGPPAPLGPDHIIIEREIDPWEKLSMALWEYGRRKHERELQERQHGHEERMLRLRREPLPTPPPPPPKPKEAPPQIIVKCFVRNLDKPGSCQVPGFVWTLYDWDRVDWTEAAR